LGGWKEKYRVIAVKKAIEDYEEGLDYKISHDYVRLKQVWEETLKQLPLENYKVIVK